MLSEREQRVRERAYFIWEREGRPHGQDWDHWLRAETEIAAESAGSDVAPASETSIPDRG